MVGSAGSGTKAHGLAGPREQSAVSGRCGNGEAQAAAWRPAGTGRGRTEVGSSRAGSLAAGGGERSLPRGYPETQKRVMLPAAPEQGWAGEGADELTARSCSPSLSQSDVKAEDPERNMPAEAGELCF